MPIACAGAQTSGGQSGQTGKITIAAERITLQRLVQQLSRQSSLNLEVDPADPQSAMPLTAYLTDVRPATVADALVHLLSTRRAPWHWERMSDPPGARYDVEPADFKPGVLYRLRSLGGARIYAEQARGRILESLASTIAVVGTDNTTSASLPDLADLQKRFQQSRAEAPRFPERGRVASEQLERFAAWDKAQKEAMRELAQVVLTRLTPGDRIKLAAGDTIRIPTKAMDADLASTLREASEAKDSSSISHYYGTGPDGSRVELQMQPVGPPIYTLVFDLHRDPFAVSPLLFVTAERHVEYKEPGGLAAATTGGAQLDTVGRELEARWRAILTKEWASEKTEPPASLPDSLPLADLANRPPASSPPKTTSPFSEPLARLVKTVEKQGKHINLLARLATFDGGASDPFSDTQAKTLGSARQALLKERAMPTKWLPGNSPSEAVLLADALPFIWTSGLDKLVAPQARDAFAELRKKDPYGFITFDTLCDLARHFSPDALESLFQDDDDQEPASGNARQTSPPFAGLTYFARQYHPLLAFLGNNPNLRQQIQSPEGVALSDPANVALQQAWQASRPSSHTGGMPAEEAGDANIPEVLRLSTKESSRNHKDAHVTIRTFSLEYKRGERSERAGASQSSKE